MPPKAQSPKSAKTPATKAAAKRVAVPVKPAAPQPKAAAKRAPKATRQAALPVWLESMEPSNRYLTLALAASLVLHAVLLMVHFRMPDSQLFKGKDSQLEVVLVNSKSARKPVDAQAKAQANLEGGGNTDENRLAKTPLPATEQQQTGNDLVQAHRRQQEAEVPHQTLVTRKQSDTAVQSEIRKEEQPEPPTQVSGADLAQSALAMARMEAAVAKDVEEYNRRPRRKQITARTQEVSYAMYFSQWRDKVERVGNLNYPEAAKGRLYGSVTLVASIRDDGELLTVEIRRPSGEKVLDDAALRIVKLAQPYGLFSPEMRREYQIFDIVATINFTKGEQIRTESR